MTTLRPKWRLRSFGLVVAVLAAVLSPLPAAEAAFPGENGRIAYGAQPEDSFEPLVYVVEPDGSSSQQLLNGAAEPNWSPDGSRLVFEQGPFPTGDILVANADGSGQTNLTNHVADDRTPAWSPDGTRIVFSSDRSPDGNHRLFIMNLDDRSTTPLTSGAGLGDLTPDFSPAWSPDGDTIVFSRGVPEEGSGASAIFRISVDGTGLTRLTQPDGVLEGFTHLGDPDWSPDGTRIAFHHGGSACSGAIFTMNADGSDPAVLVDTECYDFSPAWSPDGTKVVFESSGPELGTSPAGLYLVNADGTGLTLLLDDHLAVDPDWRPVTGDVGQPPGLPPIQPTGAVCANVDDDDRFTDDDGTTFETVIECLAHSGITAGGPGGLPESQYGPGLVVTRGQMASFIAREIDTANQLEAGAGVSELPAFDGTNDFTDVGPTNVHREAINRLSQAGITGGGPGGRPVSEFGPELAVTRAQMASFINRAHELLTGTPLATTADYFGDDDASVHQANINGIASEGIAVGDGVAAYGPDAEITRGQMAAFLVRHLAVLEEAGHITPLPA